jgi:hypothetical protein
MAPALAARIRRRECGLQVIRKFLAFLGELILDTHNDDRKDA